MRNNDEFRAIVETYKEYQDLEEKTRASKEGVDLEDTVEALEKYLTSDDLPKYFAHFSDLNKLGVNPQSKFRTPLGIYAYPITRSFVDQVKFGAVPFASNRDFIHIFKIAGDANIEWIKKIGASDNMTFYQLWEIFEQMVYTNKFNSLTEYPGFRYFSTEWRKAKPEDMGEAREKIKFIDKIWREAKFNTAFFVFWNFLRNVFKTDRTRLSASTAWAKTLRLLGYDGIVDMDTGTLHPAEPEQAVFFTKRSIEQVETVINKHKSRQAAKKNWYKKLKKAGLMWALKPDVKIKLKDEHIKRIENFKYNDPGLQDLGDEAYQNVYIFRKIIPGFGTLNPSNMYSQEWVADVLSGDAMIGNSSASDGEFEVSTKDEDYSEPLHYMDLAKYFEKAR